MAPSARVVWAAGYTLRMCQRALLEQALGKGDHRVRELAKQWSIGLADRMSIVVRGFGVDGVDWSAPSLIMANHQSYLDVLALFHALPRTFGFLAKKELFRIPLFGSVMRAMDCVEIDRLRRGEAMEQVRAAAVAVRNGATIAVFPEGTRSLGDRVARMKKGPFYLAQMAGVQVVPIGIRGTARLMPRSNAWIRPGTAEVHVGTAIPPIAASGKEARVELMTRVRSEIARLAAVPELD